MLIKENKEEYDKHVAQKPKCLLSGPLLKKLINFYS